MLFGRRKPGPLPEASRMGFRSRLVLEKLGFDLRQRYDALLGHELPDELGQLASRLNRDGIVRLGMDAELRGKGLSGRWRRSSMRFGPVVLCAHSPAYFSSLALVISLSCSFTKPASPARIPTSIPRTRSRAASR